MDNSVEVLASVIQLAIGPVFLLAGIAGFLNVMSGRLGRIVDRARQLETMKHALKDVEAIGRAKQELQVLWRRSDIINRAIGCCVASALFVCVVVASVFVGHFWHFPIAEIVVGLFVFSLMFLIVALLMFLKEVQLATRILRPGGVLENQ